MNDQATKFVLGEQLRPYSNAIRALDTLETGPLLGFADWPIGNRSLMDQLAAHTSPPGAIGLGAQMIFAMFPVIQVLRRFGKPLDR